MKSLLRLRARSLHARASRASSSRRRRQQRWTERSMLEPPIHAAISAADLRQQVFQGVSEIIFREVRFDAHSIELSPQLPNPPAHRFLDIHGDLSSAWSESKSNTSPRHASAPCSPG